MDNHRRTTIRKDTSMVDLSKKINSPIDEEPNYPRRSREPSSFIRDPSELDGDETEEEDQEEDQTQDQEMKEPEDEPASGDTIVVDAGERDRSQSVNTARNSDRPSTLSATPDIEMSDAPPQANGQAQQFASTARGPAYSVESASPPSLAASSSNLRLTMNTIVRAPPPTTRQNGRTQLPNGRPTSSSSALTNPLSGRRSQSTNGEDEDDEPDVSSKYVVSGWGRDAFSRTRRSTRRSTTQSQHEDEEEHADLLEFSRTHGGNAQRFRRVETMIDDEDDDEDEDEDEDMQDGRHEMTAARSMSHGPYASNSGALVDRRRSLPLNPTTVNSTMNRTGNMLGGENRRRSDPMNAGMPVPSINPYNNMPPPRPPPTTAAARNKLLKKTRETKVSWKAEEAALLVDHVRQGKLENKTIVDLFVSGAALLNSRGYNRNAATVRRWWYGEKGKAVHGEEIRAHAPKKGGKKDDRNSASMSPAPDRTSASPGGPNLTITAPSNGTTQRPLSSHGQHPGAGPGPYGRPAIPAPPPASYGSPYGPPPPRPNQAGRAGRGWGSQPAVRGPFGNSSYQSPYSQPLPPQQMGPTGPYNQQHQQPGYGPPPPRYLPYGQLPPLPNPQPGDISALSQYHDALMTHWGYVRQDNPSPPIDELMNEIATTLEMMAQLHHDVVVLTGRGSSIYSLRRAWHTLEADLIRARRLIEPLIRSLSEDADEGEGQN